MHPARSLILFTSLSGLGFGVLAWLGLGTPAVTGWVAFVFYLIAFGLAGGGLVASTFHLGRRERALKAFTQWQSSWLSREAWLAVAAMATMGLFALGAVFFGQHWQPLGWLGAVLSLATVFATSMIYAQLKTVPRWNMPLTPVLFLSLSIAGGALLSGEIGPAILFLCVAGALTLAHWTLGDRRFAQSGTTMETATGLGPIGQVRAFEPPHTGTNYLMREMVFRIGRKHSLKLRVMGFGLMVLLPVLILLLPFHHALAAVAVLSHVAGLFITRWLFFAEAEHVVGLYYGAHDKTSDPIA